MSLFAVLPHSVPAECPSRRLQQTHFLRSVSLCVLSAPAWEQGFALLTKEAASLVVTRVPGAQDNRLDA